MLGAIVYTCMHRHIPHAVYKNQIHRFKVFQTFLESSPVLRMVEIPAIFLFVLSLGCQFAVAAALTSFLTGRGEKKGSASNLTVGFTRNPTHRPARCTRPNSLYYILTVRPGDKVSMLRPGGPY